MSKKLHQIIQNKMRTLVMAIVEHLGEESLICQKFPKNTIILKEKEISQNLFIIKKGSLRNFIYDEKGKEITTWFAFENEMTLAPMSYFMQIPTSEMIQTMEASEIYFLQNKTIIELAQTDLVVNKLSRELLGIPILMMTDRMHSLLAKFAEERYQDMINDFPHIIQRVPLSYIAKYLGISVETLSRIRKKK